MSVTKAHLNLMEGQMLSMAEEVDRLRAQVAELRGAAEATRAKCEAIALGWADLDCRPDANVMAIQIANAIDALSPPSASGQKESK